MPAWIAIPEYAKGAILSKDDLELIREDLNFLRSKPYAEYTHPLGGSDYTKTGTAFADIDGTNLNLSIYSYGNPILVTFTARVSNSTTGFNRFEILVDGAPLSSDLTNGIAQLRGDLNQLVNLSKVVSGLAEGTHSFRMQWAVSAGTATAVAASHIQMIVREL